MKKSMFLFGILAISAVPATAGDAYPNLKYPGSAWAVVGNVSPYEKGNIISLSHAEQGISFKGIIEPYVSGTIGTDSKGYDWNNKLVGAVGVRAVQSIGKAGSVRVGAAYTSEKHTESNVTKSGVVYSADFYYGWGR